MTLLSGRTPRDSLGGCSMRCLTIVRTRSSRCEGAEHTEVRDYWNLQLDPSEAHDRAGGCRILQALLSLARPDAPLMKRIEMTPHPCWA